MSQVLAVEAVDTTNGWWATWRMPLIVVLATVALMVLVRWYFARKGAGALSETDRFRAQAYAVAIALIGFITLIFVLPDSVDGSLALSAVGLIVTGALAISSQSIIANGMAGVMIRAIKNFKPGDFIEVRDDMGRVTEMGLFHTEIQTRDRDLITLPNSVMVNEPVRVIRSSGTIVSAEIGLGYDLSRHRLKELFIVAAEKAELEDPFVQVVDLGDHAVTYRVAGFLRESTQVLARRSRLRESLLDTLHESGVEIMSPMYVARRAVDNDGLIPRTRRPKAHVEDRPTAEDKVFDKAELAAGVENLRTQALQVQADIDELEEAPLAETADEAEVRQRALARKQRLLERVVEKLDEADTNAKGG